MDSLNRNLKTDWLVLPTYQIVESSYSKNVWKIWNSLRQDPDITEKISIETIAEQQGETPKLKVKKCGFGRHEIDTLLFFEEGDEYKNTTVLTFPEGEITVKLPIDEFAARLVQFENAAFDIEQEVQFVQVHPDHLRNGSTEHQDDDED